MSSSDGIVIGEPYPGIGVLYVLKEFEIPFSFRLCAFPFAIPSLGTSYPRPNVIAPNVDY